MKNILITLSLFTLFCLPAKSQEVEGYWYGTAHVSTTGTANTYLMELIIKQEGSVVQGIINYYFKNTFRSFKINGTFNRTSRHLTLPNIPITYFGSSARMEVDCIMDFQAQLRVAKAKSNLKGALLAKQRYQLICPDINFDFELNREATNQDSILTALRQFKEEFQVWQPAAGDTLVAANIGERTVVNYVIVNEYKQRENVLAQEIEVESDSLRVTFYDNGEVDGDSISVFYNDKLLAFAQKLSTRAINVDIVLDPARDHNEITMFADNLGIIPPNTALMFINDGKKRYEVRLSSNLEKNATVRIRKKKASS